MRIGDTLHRHSRLWGTILLEQHGIRLVPYPRPAARCGAGGNGLAGPHVLRTTEKERDENLRWKHYRSIPQKHWNPTCIDHPTDITFSDKPLSCHQRLVHLDRSKTGFQIITQGFRLSFET
jgi:hypothetical protein